MEPSTVAAALEAVDAVCRALPRAAAEGADAELLARQRDQLYACAARLATAAEPPRRRSVAAGEGGARWGALGTPTTGRSVTCGAGGKGR